MATPFPSVPPDDVWGQDLIEAIETRFEDAAENAEAYADARIVVIGAQDPTPANTPTGTIILRTA
jgi:hypothetical protein